MERILLIDDEASIRLLGKRMLEGAGFDVTLAEDGPTGVECFQAHPHDLIISDLDLPGEIMFGAVTEIRKQCSDVPILIISGLDMEDEELFEAKNWTGITCTLAKPFALNEFIETVNACLGH